jgi:hypothetical protein
LTAVMPGLLARWRDARWRSAQRPPSATAAGKPRSDETREQRTSPNRRKRKGRRLLAGGSGLGHLVVSSWATLMGAT